MKNIKYINIIFIKCIFYSCFDFLFNTYSVNQLKHVSFRYVYRNIMYNRKEEINLILKLNAK